VSGEGDEVRLGLSFCRLSLNSLRDNAIAIPEMETTNVSQDTQFLTRRKKNDKSSEIGNRSFANNTHLFPH